MPRASSPTPRDQARAYLAQREKAERGDADAQHNVASYYYFGTAAVARDLKEAVVWYRKAAEQGNAQAQYNLAICLRNGEGVSADAEQAAVWYRKAAEQGHALAQCNIAFCLSQGVGVARDEAQAVVWSRKAAEQGDASAQFNLGFTLLEGAEGVPKDLKEGARFLGAAAQQGDAEALAVLTRYAGEPRVANACCVGCGATAALQSCSKCRIASFCGQACVARTSAVHTPHCTRWQAETKLAFEEGRVFVVEWSLDQY